MQPAPKRAKLSPPGSSSATAHPLLVEMSQCSVVPSAVRKLCEQLISKDEESATDTLQLSQEALDLAWERLHTGDPTRQQKLAAFMARCSAAERRVQQNTVPV